MYLLLLSYFFMVLIILYLFLVLYLKCKMPFWSKQPVFHWYNLSYWLIGPPGLISKHLPLINKYVDFFNVKTLSLTDTNESTAICEFIKDNYIYVDTNRVDTNRVDTNRVDTNRVDTNRVDTNRVDTIYAPTKANILDYLLHSNHPSYFTVYQEPKLFVQTEECTSKDIVAVISARPLYVRLNKKSLFGSEKTMFTTYYVENLCVHPAYRKKGIASTMIQTHYYNLRQQNKQITTCLFKREGELNAIVPLVVFNTYCISLTGLVNNLLAPHHTLIEIGVNQLYLCMDFIKSQMTTFSCVILPDVTSLTHLIKTENIKIYCLINANASNIIACYIFRLLELTYDGKKTCECIATINANAIDLFHYGFHQACTILKAKQHMSLLLMEETAHTGTLITPTLKSLIQFTSPTAFFFYNYACYTLKGRECLIVY
jgi:ribosomal protein S18 acetylase RimI-like enzyme